ncbi:MAG: FmdB family zinc ribbon protein [Gemmatimonadota bacterium]
MPTYEYRCRSCGHAFERFQRISEPPIRSCPECGKRRVERLISTGGGLVFKGPGFYATDYKSPAPSGKSGREGDDSAAGGKKATGETGEGAEKGARKKGSAAADD